LKLILAADGIPLNSAGLMPLVSRYLLPGLATALAVVCGIWYFWPGAKPPPQALALCHQAGLHLIAEPGPGFYGVEQKAGRRWAWSGGEATLLLHRYGPDPLPRPIRLRFVLRSLTPREVTVRHGDFVLWKGHLEKTRVPVDIPELTLVGPLTEIVFVSNLPGELAPGGHDLRPLAFALHELEITPGQ
jgi:hypothetical protein